jgi:hypothetical protein
VLCFLFFLGAIFFIPKDIHSLREQLRARADLELARQAGVPNHPKIQPVPAGKG